MHACRGPHELRWEIGVITFSGPAAAATCCPRPPVPLPKDWARLVNAPQSETEVAAVRASIARGRPFGSALWTRLAATKLGLESSLRPRGRPKKDDKK
ncbi:MAG: hypothetical protein ACR2FY_16880 [Pirellulaceae bacterium]